jgi:adenylate cyclase
MERTEKERILSNASNAVARLSPELVNQLSLNVDKLKPDTEYEGVCLATDIQGFTSRVSQMEQDGQLSEMSELMHAYWTILVRAVAQNGGFVRDFIGDAMVALWLKPEQFDNACKAALTMRAELDRFNRSNNHGGFPTRIGLHFGRLHIGSIGTAGFGTELLGEPANIASRIEGTNKDLGTQVLVSRQVHEGLVDPLVTRSLGSFLVSGKGEPIQLYELVGFRSHVLRRRTQALIDDFAEALEEFQQGNWGKAAELFETLHARNLDDGPTKFYLSMSMRYANNGPDKNWNGVAIRLPITT